MVGEEHSCTQISSTSAEIPKEFSSCLRLKPGITIVGDCCESRVSLIDLSSLSSSLSSLVSSSFWSSPTSLPSLAVQEGVMLTLDRSIRMEPQLSHAKALAIFCSISDL